MNLVDLRPSAATLARLFQELVDGYTAIYIELEGKDSDFYSAELVERITEGSRRAEAARCLASSLADVAAK